MACLLTHDYPGNVRELENIIEQAFVLCKGGVVEPEHLPPEIRPARSASMESLEGMSLKAMERLMITETLRRRRGNRKQVARDLGIDASTLYRKIKTYGIQTPPSDGRHHLDE